MCCWQKTRRMMTVATLAVGCLGKVVVLALCVFCVNGFELWRWRKACPGVVWAADLGCVRFLGVAGWLLCFANPLAL